MGHNSPGSYPPQIKPQYGGQPPPQAQPPAGYTYESYQTPIAATKASSLGPNIKSVSMASSPAATPHSRDYVTTDSDTPMEDADPYNRSKYPTRLTQHNRPSSQYMPNEESSAARRYSPMNILSPALPYNVSPTKSQNSYALPPSGPSSSRQSPTRTNTYSSPSQPYQSPPCKFWSCDLFVFRMMSDRFGFVLTAQRASRLPPIQSADLNTDQYFPLSANSQFGPDTKSPRVGQQNNQSPSSSRGPIPKFVNVKSTQELRPRLNTQPPYRRANPEGGFISVSAHIEKKAHLMCTDSPLSSRCKP
jgi:dual specificity protein kinase YAK1